MDEKYDVIIIGAGGAGLMTAKTLGDLGHKVLIIDRKADLLNLPFKTLGSFVDLNEYGLSRDVVAADINKATLYSKRLKRTASGKVYILDKVALHKEVIAKFNPKNVSVLTGITIKSFNQDSDGNISEVVDTKGRIYRGKYYIDATGVSGLISKKLGLQDKSFEVAIGVEYNVKYLGDPAEAHLYIGKQYEGGYGWIFPLKNQRAIIGFGSFEKIVIKDLRMRLDRMIKIPHIAKIVQKDNDDTEGGTIPITEVKTKFVYNNLVCVGDSVSQVNPIVGEGYRFVFRSAVLAANAISKALIEDDMERLKEYELNWSKEFYGYYKRSRKLQRLIGKVSRSDFLTDIGLLFMKTKRSSTVERLISGRFSILDILLP